MSTWLQSRRRWERARVRSEVRDVAPLVGKVRIVSGTIWARPPAPRSLIPTRIKSGFAKTIDTHDATFTPAPMTGSNINAEPYLDADWLKRIGFFAPSAASTQIWPLELGTEKVVVIADRLRTRIELGPLSSKGSLQTVRIERTKLRRGYRHFFRCPITGERCRRLYLIDGVFGGVAAFGGNRTGPSDRWLTKVYRLSDQLTGSGVSKRATGERRRRVAYELDRITAAGWFPSLAREGERALYEVLDGDNEGDELEPQPRAKPRPPRSDQRASGYSTAAALERGRNLHYRWAEDDILEELSESIETLGWGLPPARPWPTAFSQRPIAILEDHPALDVRVLTQAGLAVMDEIHAAVLQWPHGPPVLLVADLREPDEAYLLLVHRFPNGETKEEVIPLIPSWANHRARWYLRCPADGARRDLLFLRDGVFAGARAQRLVHRSQRRGLGGRV